LARGHLKIQKKFKKIQKKPRSDTWYITGLTRVHLNFFKKNFKKFKKIQKKIKKTMK